MSYLVKDYFDISEEMLAELANKSEAWEARYKFYMRLKNSNIDDITVGEMHKLETLEEDL